MAGKKGRAVKLWLTLNGQDSSSENLSEMQFPCEEGV